MNLRVNALKARYRARRLEAIADLEVYLKNPAGVGEHPQIVDAMSSLIERIADADGCLAVLDEVITSSEQNEEPINS